MNISKGFCACDSEKCRSVHLHRVSSKIFCNYKIRAKCIIPCCIFNHARVSLSYKPPTLASRAAALKDGFVADRNFVTTTEATFLNKLTEVRLDGRFLINFSSSLFFYLDNFPEQVFGRLCSVTNVLVKTLTHPKIELMYDFRVLL